MWGNQPIALPMDDNESQVSKPTPRSRAVKYVIVLALVLTAAFATFVTVDHLQNNKLNLASFQDIIIAKPAPSTVPVVPVEVIEVDPVLPTVGFAVPVETSILVDNYEFTNSYGKPFVSTFYAPSVNFTDVRLTLNASVSGRQFDRLGHIFLDGSELWRFSTAEPGGKSIFFRHTKDVSLYSSVFAKNETELKIILNNVVDDTYTGAINVTLVAEYFNNPVPAPLTIVDSYANLTSADYVLPLGEKLWSAPKDTIDIPLSGLPTNTSRVLVDIFASGNADEEFWFSHLADPYSGWYADSGLEFGKHGPIRAVEVFVDGSLAGMATPFPVIYTGGYAPSLWNPLVGIKAYDVPSYKIDLTPFLPALWSSSAKDGFTVSLKIANVHDKIDRYLIENDWIVSGNLLVWETANVTGSGVIAPDANTEKSADIILPLMGKTLREILTTKAEVNTSANLSFATPTGFENFTVQWAQKIDISNIQSVIKAGNEQNIVHASEDANKLVVNETESFSHNSSFALIASLEYKPLLDEYKVNFVRAFKEKSEGLSLKIEESANSTFSYVGEKMVSGNATTSTNLSQTLPSGLKFKRSVKAENGTIVFDIVGDAVIIHEDSFGPSSSDFLGRI